ncbi:hypothetical protein OROMI_001811 [Orobanche minor]
MLFKPVVIVIDYKTDNVYPVVVFCNPGTEFYWQSDILGDSVELEQVLGHNYMNIDFLF